MPESKKKACHGEAAVKIPHSSIGGESAGAVWQERNVDVEKLKDRPWVKSVLTSWKSSICTLLAEM